MLMCLLWHLKQSFNMVSDLCLAMTGRRGTHLRCVSGYEEGVRATGVVVVVHCCCYI